MNIVINTDLSSVSTLDDGRVCTLSNQHPVEHRAFKDEDEVRAFVSGHATAKNKAYFIAPAVAPTKLSRIEFKLLFTSAERIAIQAARASDPVIEDAYGILDDPALTVVDMELPMVVDLIGYLVAMNLLTQDRADEMLPS